MNVTGWLGQVCAVAEPVIDRAFNSDSAAAVMNGRHCIFMASLWIDLATGFLGEFSL
jgi:hypothetical protein